MWLTIFRRASVIKPFSKKIMCQKVGLAKSLSARCHKKLDNNNNQISHPQKKKFCGDVTFIFALNAIYIGLTRHELSISHHAATLQFQRK